MFEAKLPQPTSEVHGSSHSCRTLHDPPGETVCLGNADNPVWVMSVVFGQLAECLLTP
jgi:hypothetical protein